MNGFCLYSNCLLHRTKITQRKIDKRTVKTEVISLLKLIINKAKIRIIRLYR
jgi:hypothetical protein